MGWHRRGRVRSGHRGLDRRRLVLAIATLAEQWVQGNNDLLRVLLPIEWDIEGGEDLRRDGHYLIFANHISWADIFVVFRALHRRVAFIRFFVKQELVWMPVVGQASWALEFPFMKRYSADYLAQHPEKRGRDLETTRRACDRYRDIPVAILNFLEGTRFSLEKQAEQQSPYRYLLRPRTGGAALRRAAIGATIRSIGAMFSPALSNMPPLAPKSFCMSTMISAEVRRRNSRRNHGAATPPQIWAPATIAATSPAIWYASGSPYSSSRYGCSA